jgi:hypothetical protein
MHQGILAFTTERTNMSCKSAESITMCGCVQTVFADAYMHICVKNTSKLRL